MGASCCLIQVERWKVGEIAEPVEQEESEQRVAIA
jgi:hypothetical protein